MNHPSRNWRRRARDAADREALRLVELRHIRRWGPADSRHAVLIAREAYLLGYEAARKDMRR